MLHIDLDIIGQRSALPGLLVRRPGFRSRIPHGNLATLVQRGRANLYDPDADIRWSRCARFSRVLIGGYRAADGGLVEGRRDMPHAVGMPSVKSFVEYKYCSSCERTLPATADCFHRHSGRRDGWHDECRDCRSRDHKAATKKQQKADERTTIRRVAKLIREGHEVPEPEVIIRLAYKHFGGSAGITRAMYSVYEDPKSPLMAKMGVLSAFVRLMPAADEARRREAEEDDRRMKAMTREELDEHVARLEKMFIEAMVAEANMHEGGQLTALLNETTNATIPSEVVVGQAV